MFFLQIEVLHPNPNWSEMCPDKLWEQVQSVIKESVSSKCVRRCLIPAMPNPIVVNEMHKSSYVRMQFDLLASSRWQRNCST